MRTFIQLVKREFQLFWSNSVLRLLFIGAPVLYGVLFGFVYQKGKVTDLNILVVDQDNTPLSNRLVDMLNDNEVLHVVEVKPERLNLKQDLIRLDGQAIVVIPDRFEADVLQNRSPEVNVEINLANILTANYASRSIQLVLGSLNAGLEMEALRKRGTPEYALQGKYEAFGTNYVRLYNRSSNYMSFLWPGMLATIVQQVLLLALALSFAQEYERGTFKSELLVKTRSPLIAILVKCMPYWLMMIPIGMFFWGLQQYFHVPLIPNQAAPSLLLFALFIAASSFMGILVSVLIPSQLKATEVLMVVATPSFVLSGFTWPLSQMPRWVAMVADIIPLTHFLGGYRILLMQEGWWGAVNPQLIALTVLTVVFGLLSYGALALKMRREAGRPSSAP